MGKIIKTKYGNARYNEQDGYWQITTKSEGNKGKALHRCIYEDYHKCTILPSIVVHHKDHNKTNNSIDNLELMTWKQHTSHHHKGRKLSMERRKQISNLRSKPSKYLNVVKTKSPYNKQGYIWKYKYFDENGKLKAITSVNIHKLKEKVIAQGLLWQENPNQT